MSTDHPPAPPPDPLAIPGVIRIVIEPHQAKPFPALGETFICVAPGSWPEAPGRTVLYAVPCPREVLLDAQRVVVGTHKAVRIKTPKGD